MEPGDLRTWNSRSNGIDETPFLIISIRGLDVTIMDCGEIYSLSKASVEEFSDEVVDD